MQSRRTILITAVAIVIALMFVAAVVLVVRGFSAFYRAEAQLEVKKAELEQLYQRKPFPSAPNLDMERANLEALNGELAGLLEAMGRGQIKSVDQSPPKFMAQFWETRKDLMAKAKDMDVKLANGADFDFGFGRHMQGNLPAPQDVPRLTQQLKIVQSLCGVLYASRIAELRGIGREEFEVDAVSGASVKPEAAAGRRRGEPVAALSVVSAGAGLIPEGNLFGLWHFTVVFTAKNSALVDVFNGLAKDALFIVVTQVEIVGEDKLFLRSSGAPQTEKRGAQVPAIKSADVPKEAAAALTRDQRVVCGRDTPLTVRMEMDVYQFANASSVVTGKAEGTR